MIKAVLFDLDGVLVDTEALSFEASDKVLSEVGIKTTEEERERAIGRRTIDNYRDYIKARNLKLDPYELIEKKSKVFKELIRGRVKSLPGVLELIGVLKENNIKIAVVSSSPKERVYATLEEMKLKDTFDTIIVSEHVQKGKPDPEPFTLAANRLNVKPEECVAVEDSKSGVLSAKNAGMKCIAVKSSSGYGQDVSKADIIVDSLDYIDLGMIMGLQ